MITAIKAREMLQEREALGDKSNEKVIIPEDVDKVLTEFIENAIQEGHTYTILLVSRSVTKNSNEVEKFVIENFHAVMEYLKENGYEISVTSETSSRSVFISW